MEARDGGSELWGCKEVDVEGYVERSGFSKGYISFLGR
jgi:hypothetical protein